MRVQKSAGKNLSDGNRSINESIIRSEELQGHHCYSRSLGGGFAFLLQGV